MSHHNEAYNWYFSHEICHIINNEADNSYLSHEIRHIITKPTTDTVQILVRKYIITTKPTGTIHILVTKCHTLIISLSLSVIILNSTKLSAPPHPTLPTDRPYPIWHARENTLLVTCAMHISSQSTSSTWGLRRILQANQSQVYSRDRLGPEKSQSFVLPLYRVGQKLAYT